MYQGIRVVHFHVAVDVDGVREALALKCSRLRSPRFLRKFYLFTYVIYVSGLAKGRRAGRRGGQRGKSCNTGVSAQSNEAPALFVVSVYST